MSKLVIETSRYVTRLYWWIPEDCDIGGALGEVELKGDLSKMDPEDRELAVACRAARTSAGVQCDDEGFYWDSESLARKALTAIKTAWQADKSERPWPQWAIEAKNAGWRAPKGWSP